MAHALCCPCIPLAHAHGGDGQEEREREIERERGGVEGCEEKEMWIGMKHAADGGAQRF